MYSPNAYDYDISEAQMGTWTKDEYGIPYFVPARDLEGEQLEGDLARGRLFRALNMSGWQNSRPRIWPARAN